MQLLISHISAREGSRLEPKRLFVLLFALAIAGAFLWQPGPDTTVFILVLINLMALGVATVVTAGDQAFGARGLVQALAPLHLAGLVWLAILAGGSAANPAFAVPLSFAGLAVIAFVDLAISIVAAFAMARIAGTSGDTLSALILADKYGGLLGETR